MSTISLNTAKPNFNNNIPFNISKKGQRLNMSHTNIESSIHSDSPIGHIQKCDMFGEAEIQTEMFSVR